MDISNYFESDRTELKQSICYAGEKVRKIRWIPSSTDPLMHSTFADSFAPGQTSAENVADTRQLFVTGSWDAEINCVKLWAYDNSKDTFQVLSKIPVAANTNEIQFLTHSEFVTASDNGDVELYSIKDGLSPEISVQMKWHCLHSFANGETSSCSCLDVHEQNIVTGGEDGRVNFLTLASDRPVYRKDEADSCAIRCVCFLKHRTVIVGNSCGQMKIIDSRALQSPCQTFRLTETGHGDGSIMGAQTVVRHPTHTYTILIGSESGSIAVWDLRKIASEINVFDAHTAPISELKVHAKYPQQLFSCSLGGDVWHWRPKSNGSDGGNTSYPSMAASLINMSRSPHYSSMRKNTFSTLDSPDPNKLWLNGANSIDKIEIKQIVRPVRFPISSIDVTKTRLLAAADNEGIYLVQNLPVTYS